MTEEKSITLKGKFPRLFENGFSFECDDGWFSMLESALLLLNQHVVLNSYENFEIKQIKEKFGKLRIYTNINDDYIYGVTNMVEHLSSNYCEVCGSPGELRNANKRVRNLCTFHQNEYLKTVDDPNQTIMEFTKEEV